MIIIITTISIKLKRSILSVFHVTPDRKIRDRIPGTFCSVPFGALACSPSSSDTIPEKAPTWTYSLSLSVYMLTIPEKSPLPTSSPLSANYMLRREEAGKWRHKIIFHSFHIFLWAKWAWLELPARWLVAPWQNRLSAVAAAVEEGNQNNSKSFSLGFRFPKTSHFVPP